MNRDRPEFELPAALLARSDLDPLRRRLVRVLGGLAAALLLVLMTLGLTAASRDAELQPAPAFALDLIEGGGITNADLAGRVAVINVWASWCPPCREEAPALRRTVERFEGQPVAFLGVVRDDTAEDARAFAHDWGLDYPHAAANRSFLSAFRATGIPMTYVLDAQGRILARHYGPISESNLTALITDALARPAEDSSTPSPAVP